MDNTWIYSFLSVSLISLVSMIGVLVISIYHKLTHRKPLYLVSLSAGAMLGGAFFHLLPESLEVLDISIISTMALGGIFTSYFIEMLLHWRHCHIPTSEDHPHTFVYMNLIGDSVHNFIDGLIVAGSFQIDTKLGLATSFAIILHEIPQEIGDFGVLLYGGVETRRALLYNLISGLTAVLGVFVYVIVGSRVTGLTQFLTPFAFGNFIYIAGSDLVPELRDEKELSKSLIQFLFMVLGVLLSYYLKLFE